jgi:hypothetical protein
MASFPFVQIRGGIRGWIFRRQEEKGRGPRTEKGKTEERTRMMWGWEWKVRE